MGSFVISPTKADSATLPLVVDFISQLVGTEALTAIETEAFVSSGVDASPEAILDGLPTLSQNIVTQVLTGGIVGVIYRINFNATTNAGNNLTISTYVAVVSDNPFQE